MWFWNQALKFQNYFVQCCLLHKEQSFPQSQAMMLSNSKMHINGKQKLLIKLKKKNLKKIRKTLWNSEWIHCEFKQCLSQQVCSISREILLNLFNYFMCCSLACFLLLYHNKKTKRFDDLTVHSELCIVDSGFVWLCSYLFYLLVVSWIR